MSVSNSTQTTASRPDHDKAFTFDFLMASILAGRPLPEAIDPSLEDDVRFVERHLFARLGPVQQGAILRHDAREQVDARQNGLQLVELTAGDEHQLALRDALLIDQRERELRLVTAVELQGVGVDAELLADGGDGLHARLLRDLEVGREGHGTW